MGLFEGRGGGHKRAQHRYGGDGKAQQKEAKEVFAHLCKGFCRNLVRVLVRLLKDGPRTAATI